jgi:hypothetical protein
MKSINNHYIVKLGRKPNRTKGETEFLYTKISELVDRKEDEDIQILLCLFEPFIYKIIGYIYKQYPFLMRDFLTHGDLKQQGYLFLLECIKDYENTLASFQYFIKKFMIFKFNDFISKYNRIQKHEFFMNGGSPSIKGLDFEIQMLDKFMGDSFVHFCNFLAKKESKSMHKEQVIKRAIINREPIADLAREYGVSYHAVYQMVNRSLYDLSNMLNESKYSTLYIDNSGISPYKNYLGSYKIMGY